jgi:activator of HSP90 ATPase
LKFSFDHKIKSQHISSTPGEMDVERKKEKKVQLFFLQTSFPGKEEEEEKKLDDKHTHTP